MTPEAPDAVGEQADAEPADAKAAAAEPADAEPADGGATPAPEVYLPVGYVDLAVALPSTNPVVLLQEQDPPGRLLRIPVGLPEGVAISYAAQSLETPKPLTHELMTTLFEAFGLAIEVVRITAVRGAAFSGELVVSGPSGTRTLPCRPSDGIALALRQRLFVPVVAAARVLEVAGVLPETGPAGPETEVTENRPGGSSSGS